MRSSFVDVRHAVNTIILSHATTLLSAAGRMTVYVLKQCRSGKLFQIRNAAGEITNCISSRRTEVSFCIISSLIFDCAERCSRKAIQSSVVYEPYIHRVREKKVPLYFFAITLPNRNRPSKFFHLHTQQ